MKIYRLFTGKDASVYWDAVASKYKGKCLPFLTEILEIFGQDGDPAQYLRKNWTKARIGPKRANGRLLFAG